MSVLYSPCSDLASAIRSLQHKVMSSDDDPVCLEVRRDCLLIDSLKDARKKKFDPKKALKVELCYYDATHVYAPGQFCR